MYQTQFQKQFRRAKIFALLIGGIFLFTILVSEAQPTAFGFVFTWILGGTTIVFVITRWNSKNQQERRANELETMKACLADDKMQEQLRKIKEYDAEQGSRLPPHEDYGGRVLAFNRSGAQRSRYPN